MKNKNQSKKIGMKNPLDIFFSLGDKVTKGDPVRKSKFDYSLLWIIFLAFFSILVTNLINFFNTYNFVSLGWAGVMFGILWFQYFALKQSRQVVKTLEQFSINNQNLQSKQIPQEKMKEESIDEMLKGFKNVRKKNN